jgi:hypothetical protein
VWGLGLVSPPFMALSALVFAITMTAVAATSEPDVLEES